MDHAAPHSLAVEWDDVQFAYDQTPVLNGVRWQIETGAFVGLLGPNGSGKTTLIQLTCAALRMQAGAIRIFGMDLASWERRELARSVAVVPQHFQLSFPFTVEEVVLLGRVPHRGAMTFDRASDRSVAAAAMQATGVFELRARHLHELSGGEFKRVVVAKALAQQPRLLLLDEPAAHLDIRHQVELYDLIDTIRRREGLTVLAAMHDLNFAAAYCNRVALLKNGVLFRAGTVEEVMTYRNLSATFDCDIYVGINDQTGQRLFTPMIQHPRDA
jgi:ABC-type cobalamin/Fe3+-siderophores transport systems, ATPase components